MAENRSEITFAEIKEAMKLQEDEVEEFLIEVIKTRLVRAKISQVTEICQCLYFSVIFVVRYVT